MSVHETWQMSVDTHLSEPSVLEVYADLRRRMNARKFEPLVAVVTQRWREAYDLYDAYAFGQVYAKILAGNITLTPIHLGSCQSGDARTEENNAKLMGLPSPFKAFFRGGSGDNDGSFSWTEQLFIGELALDPQEVPLEVGYTRPLTTLWHLQHERCLARWPYGHDKIWLLRCSCVA